MNQPKKGWLKDIGGAALGLALVPVFFAALAGVWNYLAIPLFNDVIAPILNPVLDWLAGVAREWGIGWAIAAFIGILMAIGAVWGLIQGLIENRRESANNKKQPTLF
jgi:hypothetical protein